MFYFVITQLSMLIMHGVPPTLIVLTSFFKKEQQHQISEENRSIGLTDQKA